MEHRRRGRRQSLGRKAVIDKSKNAIIRNVECGSDFYVSAGYSWRGRVLIVDFVQVGKAMLCMSSNRSPMATTSLIGRCGFSRFARRLIGCLVWLVCCGCTHHQLTRNTALTATTVNSIQYRMVLDNIAMFSCQPGSLPAHVRLADGTVQISNQLSFGEAGGFSVLDGGPFTIEQWGPGGSSKVSEQWGTDAVSDPLQVIALQTIYRKAFGLQPVPTPNFIREAERAASESESGGGNSGDSDSGNSDSGDQNGSAPKLRAEDFDIPLGWFHIGQKRDVPKDACYVGRYGDRYAWVDAHGVDGLSQFTLAVLAITKSSPDEGSGRTGLMVTP